MLQWKYCLPQCVWNHTDSGIVFTFLITIDYSIAPSCKTSHCTTAVDLVRYCLWSAQLNQLHTLKPSVQRLDTAEFKTKPLHFAHRLCSRVPRGSCKSDHLFPVQHPRICLPGGKKKHCAISELLFFLGATAPSGPGSPHYRGFTITHLDTHTSRSVGLLWTSDRPVAETSTWQHTTLTRDRHPCLRGDLNPQSQQANGRRPTP
jgi:hypothetical protein